MTLLLPPPDDPGPDNGQPGLPPGGQDPPHRSSGSRRPQGEIPTVEDILKMLLHLNGLVVTGLIPTPRANAVHRTLQTVLNTQLKRQQQQSQVPDQEPLAEACRKDPRLVTILEPFLSDDQIAWLLGQIKEGPHDQA
jgi:hypothetical protein